MEKIKVVIVLGPTASGKSAIAVDLARLFGGEIVNADSMQVYRFLDIGTAKPSPEALREIPHHLLNIVPPDEDYTAARFASEGRKIIEEIHSRGRRPIVAGGTGLYIKALTRGIFEGPSRDYTLKEKLLRDAELLGKDTLYERLKEADPASSIHPNNLRRVVRALEVYELTKRPMSELQREHAFSDEPFDTLKIGLMKSREALYSDIESRVERMMEEGFVEEVRRLLEMGYSPELKPLGGIGYKEVVSFLKGSVSIDEAVGLIKRNTRRYAKRQTTWFRKDPEIKWFSPEDKEAIIGLVRSFVG